MAKPIFIMGLPNSTSREGIKQSQENLQRKLYDYHVVVLLNVNEIHTAKIYSEKGSEIFSIDKIKELLKQ